MQIYTVWGIRESGSGALMDLEAAGTAVLYFEGVVRLGQNEQGNVQETLCLRA